MILLIHKNINKNNDFTHFILTLCRVKHLGISSAILAGSYVAKMYLGGLLSWCILKVFISSGLFFMKKCQKHRTLIEIKQCCEYVGRRVLKKMRLGKECRPSGSVMEGAEFKKLDTEPTLIKSFPSTLWVVLTEELQYTFKRAHYNFHKN